MPTTEAEWRAQPGPWAHLTKEQTDSLMSAERELLEKRIAELERIISMAGDALTTPYANDEERIENARRILEQG